LVCQRLKRAVGNQTRTYSYSSDIKEILVFGDVEAQKQSTEAIEILKRMLELRRKLDDLSYAPCPKTGLYAGLEGIKNWGRLHTTERNADTDEIANEFTDNGDPLGGGIVLGYNFRPWHDSSSARSIGWTRRSTTPSRADRSSALDPIRSRRSAGKPVSSPPLACSFMASPGRPG
jgi:hypothetical protein